MIAELGLLALILALLFACLLVIVPAIGLKKNNTALIAAAPYYVYGQFIFIAVAYCCLTYCFLSNDFTVIYVLANSSLNLPWIYKACAVWGGHEGSMLLWVAILSLWIAAVCRFSNNLSYQFRIRVLMVLGFLSIGLIIFILSVSNPFLRQFADLTSQGRDLNPLLQDPGFLFHPPMLYMGYVGFAVAFAFAVAALWLGDFEPAWARWARPWTLAAWCCLTTGITLGSWWAYRELGWGGWWFWDPVENASFMPWLAGTALIHSLSASDKRRQFIAWTFLLAIIAFSLSLVGTFLVRSGVLTSVHAFAVDPKRGIYILLYLLLVIGGALGLFALRAPILPTQKKMHLWSRESALLLNNIFLMSALLTILLGTVYPLLIDGLGLGKLSVGAPYFNAVFVPLMLPVMFLMGVGIHLHWGKNKHHQNLFYLFGFLLAALIVCFALLWFLTNTLNGYTVVSLVLAGWVLRSTASLVYQRIRQLGWQALSNAFLGMVIAHCGVAITVVGIALSTGYGEQEDIRVVPGETVKIGGYHITYVNETTLQGSNYHGSRLRFMIRDGKKIKTIYPEKRIYDVGQMAMTEAAIDVNPFRDIYIALGEPFDDQAWSVRIYIKPFIRWIWSGGFIILAGGLIAMLNPANYRKAKILNLDEAD